MADAEKETEPTPSNVGGGVEGGGEAGGEEEEPTYESTAIFTPVVQLDEVETKTHEEDEETLYRM